MIIDLQRFLRREQPHWAELETLLTRLESDAPGMLPLDKLARLHLLHRRAGSDLMKVKTYSRDPALIGSLERLVARSYAVIHGQSRARTAWRPGHWLLREFPRAFRRHALLFWMALGITLLGALFGAGLTLVDEENKHHLIPAQFGYHRGSPSERVAREESGAAPGVEGREATFSAQLMSNNIQVGLMCLGLGFTAGLGTCVMLFYNGVILGVICLDYARAGEGEFLAAWLLPHGVPELTAIFIAGQAGLVIGRLLLGWRDPRPLRSRFREVRADLATLAGGMAVMLVWAGFVESFLSQYHEPRLPYEVKIAFGLVELVLLVAFLARAGRAPDTPGERA